MRSNYQTVRGCLALAVLAVAAACGRSSDSGGASVAFGKAAKSQPELNDGDVRITSTDNVLVLSVIGDSVRMQLSDSLRNSVSKTVDSSTASGGAIAAAIGKSVGAMVQGAMGFVVSAHVNDVENLRYENGHLRFETRGGGSNFSTKGSGNSDKRESAAFTAQDARRFIAAVESRRTNKVENKTD